MQRIAIVLLALGCVLVGAVLHALMRPPPPAVPEAGPVEVARTDEATGQRLDRIEGRLEEVAQALAALRVQRASASTRPAATTAGSPDPQLRGSASAEQATASATKPPAASFDDLGNEALAAEARSLARGKADLPGSLQRWRALLARNLPPDERLNAQLGYAKALRADGQDDQAVSTLRQAISEAASDSPEEHLARMQLGGTLFWKGDYRGALEEAQTVATSRNALEWQVPGARWNMVTAMIKLGDKAGARRELESMIADYTGKEGMEALLRQYRNQLAQLE